MVAAADAPPLRFDEAWIRAAPPTARVLAGYGVFRNVGAQTIHVDSAHSADFARAELHEMSTVDGVMRMRKLDGIDVPAGGQLTFEPGALHLMLFDPKRALAVGDTVEMEFRAGEQRFRAVLTVRAP